MEANRVYNFNPGPATLPLSVLKEAQAEFLNFGNSGMSILEISHRAKPYAAVHAQAKADIKELMGLGDDYEVLFCQGVKRLGNNVPGLIKPGTATVVLHGLMIIQMVLGQVGEHSAREMTG